MIHWEPNEVNNSTYLPTMAIVLRGQTTIFHFSVYRSCLSNSESETEYQVNLQGHS